MENVVRREDAGSLLFVYVWILFHGCLFGSRMVTVVVG